MFKLIARILRLFAVL